MGKPGLSLFTARRKSLGNAFDEVDVATSPDTSAANKDDSGGFRLLSRTEVEKANERRKTLEKSSKFPRFSGFGSTNKTRNQSFDDESPASSNRDSKSSSGTAFSSSRPYTNGQHGSTSTLPSSTDTSSEDNIFASVPRPTIPQHNSSPSSYPVSGIRKQLPSLPSAPRTSSGVSYKDQLASGSSRNRAMTTSSYASTAVAPKLEANLNFDSSSFEDDMFSHIHRKESPEMPRESVGRSLLSEKRTFHAEPIKIRSQFDVEPPLKSWDSRGSADNLMAASPRSDDDSPPPPPPHKFSSYAPVASESPTLQSAATFQDADAQFVRKSYTESKFHRESSPETQPISMSSSSANSFETPMSSRSATASSNTTNTTPKAALAPTQTYDDSEEDNLFTAARAVPKAAQVPKQAPSATAQQRPPPTTTVNGSRVMSQAEFREVQKRQASQPYQEEDSDEEDYEDEEEAIKKREEEEVMRRKNQQMHFAREAMRRSTTAPGNPSMPDGPAPGLGLGMGFPSETSMKADEWEDEDVPLGILAQHGFPSQTQSRLPSQPLNAHPSYLPDRPASAGAMTQRTSQANLPAFARNLPADPYAASFVGGGLVRPINRESMGFNGFARGPGSVAGESVAGGMNMAQPMMYQDAGISQPSLVDQIQMRDLTKQKYMGGASAKKPQAGPFTGMLGQHMNASGQPQSTTRMPQVPMNNMNPMMGGQMPMMGMGMGMNPMGYPMSQQNDYMQQQYQQMQQMIAMQQFQLQQMQAMQMNPQQDPRMSMAMPNSGFQGNMMGNGSFLNVPGVSNGMPNQQNRPMSFMSGHQNQQQHQMPNFLGPNPGYTPSIAPSERSNIGLSARYRPVVNHSDSMSNGTSMTLQATGGAQSKPGVIKGILKKGSPTLNVKDNDQDDEDWGSMAARKSKFAKGKENNGTGLEELTRGLNI